MTDAVPVVLVGYTDKTDPKVEVIDGEHKVTNHEDLETKQVVRGFKPHMADRFGYQPLREGDDKWRAEFENIDVGEQFDV